ncbi:hypothetical protein N7509_008349 [Penicillium cosmopolitanum]|uniref:Uncharacterized protein n=1 Tax=Penicillium cosmopolitanum TaxID=1131564 RepID=A0A9W9VME5_9EURO|nr:uncharacterized protein N7509_008349 [Penicillium cosmopolitanum]KAJ5385808.1 hypothetical protein N7509_008349 [Penicillium cosmopolitanum]
MSTRQFVIAESWGPHYTAVSLDAEGSKDRLFIENSPHAPKKPDLTLHRTDVDGAVLGLTQFQRFSSNCNVRLENDDNEIHLAKKGLVSPSYTFDIHIHGKKRSLAWKRTRSLGNHRTPHGNIKLIDEESQEVMAVFSRDGFAFVPGCLDIYGTYGENFEQLSLLTGLAVREQQRRQTTRSVRAGQDNVYTMGVVGVGGGGGGGGC